MTDTTHKTTAVALQNRRLATVTKKRGIWKAEATEAGRIFVEHGSYPPGHWATSAPPVNEPLPQDPLPRRLQTVPRLTPRHRVTGLRPVDQMIVDVVAAGGSLKVEDDRNYYDNLVSSAIRHGKVPEGKLLQIRHGKRWRDKTVELIDKPAWMSAVLGPIAVPERLIKPHLALVALRSDGEHRLLFKRVVRQRALRLLDAIAKNATGRGRAVSCPSWSRYERDRVADLVIGITGHDHELHVTEDDDKVPHEPTAKELRDFERWGYPRIPKYDKVPSGRLTITIQGGKPVRQSSFGDTLDLADRLPVVLQELELRAAAAEERRLEAERAAAERRRHWEQVRDEAVVASGEHTRAKLLLTQANQWHQSQLLGEYIAAMEQRVLVMEGDEQAAAQEWLAWAAAHREQSKPLNNRLAMPPDPEPKPDALQPFMRGLSPYGPETGARWR